jgi:hypothetical protein
MGSVTHRITATREDGEVLEVCYGYGPYRRRYVTCNHCEWREQITWGGAAAKALDHLAGTHGASGAQNMSADRVTMNQTLVVMLVCFAVAALLLVITVNR